MASNALIPGTYNSRDLRAGGLMRPRAVIRSDAPVALGGRGRAALGALGVRSAIDLRQPVERELDPADLGGLGLVVHRHPLFGDGLELTRDTSLADVYRRVIEDRGDRLTAVLRLLGAPGALPALVFCSAGKDRTGLVAALVLGAVGADSDAIVRDYALTEDNMHGDFRQAIVGRATRAGITEQELAAKVGSPPALMWDTLRWLDAHHGGIEPYLRHHGMTSAELDTLRRALRAPDAARAA